MAHRDQSTSDLSLRHLPDVSQSNASLSFEIPLIVNSADLLLADNSDDFLRGVDSSLTTPPPPKRILDSPLTLSELTPTPRAAHVAGIPIPSLHQRNTKSPEISRARHSPQKTPQSFARILSDTPNLVPSPVNAVRFANLRAEIDSLGRDSAEEADPSNHTVTQVRTAKAPAARLKRGEKLRKGDDRKPKIKATVVEGRVTKGGIKNKLPRSNFSRALSSASRQPKVAGQALIRPGTLLHKITANGTKETMGDEVKTNVVTSDGVADRLVLLSQRLMMNEVGILDDFEDLDNGAHDLTTVDQPISSSPSSSRKDDIFTLSQISPRKEDDSTVAPACPSPTPVKTGRKRPVSVTSDASSLGPRKRGKTAPFPVRRSSKPGVPILQPTTCNNGAASSATTLLSSPRRRTRLGPHIRQALALKEKAIEEPSTSNVPNYPQQPDDSHKPIIFAGDQRPSKTLKPGASMGTGKQTARLPRSNSTNSAGFAIGSGTRQEAQKAGCDDQLSTSAIESWTKLRKPPIPDFKALHAAELQASLVFRKERKAPTVPITPELTTKLRAKERERFDEVIRQKEMEMNRIKEQRRKAREEEEALEVKELRKRSVPRANEVPDWYADAPKKGGSVHS